MNKSRRTFLSNTVKATTAFYIPNILRSPINKKIAIRFYPDKVIGSINPNIYGQFIEFADHCIDGGIYQENTPLSETNGFRKDVLAYMQELNAPILRFPGGTVTKIYAWKDGIGPKQNRPLTNNLIWGGVYDNHFGTNEYIQYCKRIHAEPFITVNMSTGSAQEASEWVAYCNTKGNTYWSQARSKNGNSSPFDVKIWGLGNEEEAKEDVGRLQNPDDYIKEAWYYAKLMKLQDPDIQLVIAGGSEEWNKKILSELHSIADYISLHLYASTQPNNPQSLFQNIHALEGQIKELQQLIKTITPDKIDNFSKWYRFPSRKESVKIALDEWGIWESNGQGKYGLEVNYNWNHALGTATFLNTIQRHADIISLANWAQSVNVLSAILANNQGAIKQTVFYPLAAYRKLCGNKALLTDFENPTISGEIQALDISTTYSDNTHFFTLSIVNRDAENEYDISIPQLQEYNVQELYWDILNAPSPESKNTLEHPLTDVVQQQSQKIHAPFNDITVPAHSINFIRFKKS